MSNFYFLRCVHCGREWSADPSHFIYNHSSELVMCPVCVRPPMDLMHKGHRSISKAKERATVYDVRFPPPMLDTRDITVLLVQRGYKRFQIVENYKEEDLTRHATHTFWSLSKQPVIDFEHTLLWVYPVKEAKIDLWTNQDVILFDREKEKMRDYDTDPIANAKFLRSINPDQWTEEEKRR